jgi:hypothetical protein
MKDPDPPQAPERDPSPDEAPRRDPPVSPPEPGEPDPNVIDDPPPPGAPPPGEVVIT